MSNCTTQKTISGKRKLSKEIVQSNLYQNHFLGVKIINSSNGEVLVDYNSEKLFTPASNTKLLTFYVADKILSDSVPTFEYCLSNDTLYFSGLGDPTFLHPDFEEQNAFNFLKSHRGVLAYSPKETMDDKYGPGWAWDDYPYYFQPEKSSLPIYGNQVWIRKDSTQNQLEIFPVLSDLTIIRSDSSIKKTEIKRLENENSFAVQIDSDKNEVDESIPFIVSDSVVLTLLEDTLDRKVFHLHFPKNCVRKITYNYPKDSLFKKLLIDSDNFIAEQLLVSTSLQLFDTIHAERLIEKSLEKYFVDWQDIIKWKDGSGLSRYNMISPNFMVWLLGKIYEENDWQRLQLLFPDGGKEGTIDKILLADEPFVFAKSGSMTGVYNLSGYLITDAGDTLIFSIMNNNFRQSIRSVRREVEKILYLLGTEY